MNNAITCHSLESFESHGINQINTFLSLWPKDCKLLILIDDLASSEDIYEKHKWNKNRIILKRFDNIELIDFKRKHKKKKFNGFKYIHYSKTINPLRFLWRLRFFKYTFMFDVCKFSHKVFAMHEASKYFKEGMLFWLDGDLITHSKVDDNFFNYFNNPYKISYHLDRINPPYTETGFIAFNLNHEYTKKFFEQWINYYIKSFFLKLSDGWTDCHTYDSTRKDIGLTFFHNLTSVECHHPLINCFLGNYFDHLKGSRKSEGKSARDGDRIIQDDHPYWNNNV